MTELKALGLVSMDEKQIQCEDGVRRNVMVISPKEQFNWFLSEEFKTLREGFKPGESQADGSGSTAIDDDNIANDARKEKYPPPTATNNDHNTTDPKDNEGKNRAYGGKFFTRLQQ
jgi:hypothetical protein